MNNDERVIERWLEGKPDKNVNLLTDGVSIWCKPDFELGRHAENKIVLLYQLWKSRQTLHKSKLSCINKIRRAVAEWSKTWLPVYVNHAPGTTTIAEPDWYWPSLCYYHNCVLGVCEIRKLYGSDFIEVKIRNDWIYENQSELARFCRNHGEILEISSLLANSEEFCQVRLGTYGKIQETVTYTSANNKDDSIVLSYRTHTNSSYSSNASFIVPLDCLELARPIPAYSIASECDDGKKPWRRALFGMLDVPDIRQLNKERKLLKNFY